MSMEWKISQIANRDVRDRDGPLEIAGHIALASNRFEWVDFDPLDETNVGDNC